MGFSYMKGELPPYYEFLPSFDEKGEIKREKMGAMKIKGGISDEMLTAFHNTPFNTLQIKAGNWLAESDFLLARKEPLTRLSIDTDAIDWNVIAKLSDLTFLYIGGLYTIKFNLFFSNFIKLKRLDVFWNKGFKDDIYQLPELEKLCIWSWKEKDCKKLVSLKKLKHLDLINCRALESLSGLEQLQSLETIEIDGSNKLIDISALLSLPKLRHIKITSCKKVCFPNEFGKVMSLSLRSFYYTDCGKVDSFKFMQGADKLEYISTSGTTSINPNIGFIYKLPNIFTARIQQARHYIVSKSDLDKAVNVMYADGYKEEDKKRRLSIFGDRDRY